MRQLSVHSLYAGVVVLLATGAFVFAAGDGPPARTLPYRGHVELDGVGVNATVDMLFEVYDDPTAGVLLHEETLSVPVVGGDFAVILGQDTPLADAVLTAAELHLAVTVDGTPLSGRQPIHAAHRVMDNPGTYTLGTLDVDTVSATTIGTETLSSTSVTTNSLNTATAVANALTLTGSPNQPLYSVQSGVIGTCNGTDHTSQAATVTFTTPFSSPPIVMLTVGETDDSGCTSARIRELTNTLFRWRSYQGTTTDACDCIHWLAIGQ